MGIAPETVVDPPATTPPLHSLVSPATLVTEPDGSRWESGFTFQPENCISAEAWNACAEDYNTVISITVADDATGGTWAVEYDNLLDPAFTSDPIAFDATTAEVQVIMTALEVAASLTAGSIVVTNGDDLDQPFSWNFELAGDLADLVFGTDFTFLPVNIDLVTAAKFAVIGDLVQEGGTYKKTKKAYDGDQEEVSFSPYIVEVPYTCSSFGFQGANYRQRAIRQLMATRNKAIEHEFWTGSINPTNPSLVRSSATILNPGGATPVALSPVQAIMFMASALSECGSGGRGMIHATSDLVELWLSLSAIQESGDLLTTRGRGDIVVNGSGYPGTGPLGQPNPVPGSTVWAYATGMVNVRVGQPEIYPYEFSEALDRSTNTVTYRGEMVAAATHDLCCNFAVLVDLCKTNECVSVTPGG